MSPDRPTQRLVNAVQARWSARRVRRLGLCGVCRRPVFARDEHRWIRGHVFHGECTAAVGGPDGP
ncbi:MAG TPA: hypothetical protein VGF25_21080 [Thermoleophilaceae bacterium]